MKNIGLILLGWALILPAMILSPILRAFWFNPYYCPRFIANVELQRPWVDGLFANLLRAYLKYDGKSWRRRAISIYKTPELTLEYLRVLFNRQAVEYVGMGYVPVEGLKNAHSVQTDHAHHRARVAQLKAQKGSLFSDYGDMVIVDDTVHDGNHRLAAVQEAGTLEQVFAIRYRTRKQA